MNFLSKLYFALNHRSFEVEVQRETNELIESLVYKGSCGVHSNLIITVTS